MRLIKQSTPASNTAGSQRSSASDAVGACPTHALSCWNRTAATATAAAAAHTTPVGLFPSSLATCTRRFTMVVCATSHRGLSGATADPPASAPPSSLCRQASPASTAPAMCACSLATSSSGKGAPMHGCTRRCTVADRGAASSRAACTRATPRAGKPPSPGEKASTYTLGLESASGSAVLRQ